MNRTCITFSVNNLQDFKLYEDVLEKAGINRPLPFVEILWDNFCHLNPHDIAEFIAPFADKVAFHIMWSGFLDRTNDQLKPIFNRLREHVQVLDPIYVSDHLCRFTSENVHLQIPLECFYDNIKSTMRRVEEYQEAISREILLENYASTEPHGSQQIEYFNQLRSATGCGLLFDISNARVADLNCVSPFSHWLPVIEKQQTRCHIGSFSYNDKTGLYHDTHDTDLDNSSISDVLKVASCANVASICYERDYENTSTNMARDYKNLIACFDAT